MVKKKEKEAKDDKKEEEAKEEPKEAAAEASDKEDVEKADDKEEEIGEMDEDEKKMVREHRKKKKEKAGAGGQDPEEDSNMNDNATNTITPGELTPSPPQHGGSASVPATGANIGTIPNQGQSSDLKSADETFWKSPVGVHIKKLTDENSALKSKIEGIEKEVKVQKARGNSAYKSVQDNIGQEGFEKNREELNLEKGAEFERAPL